MTASSNHLVLKLRELSDKIWSSDKWDVLFESKAITILGVMVTGMVAGWMLPEVTFDDGSVMHTKEIFWAGALGFIIAMGFYTKRSRYYQ